LQNKLKFCIQLFNQLIKKIMKNKIFLLALMMLCTSTMYAQAKQKLYNPLEKKKWEVTTNPKLGKYCACQNLNVEANIWIEAPVATSRNYILEIQFSPKDLSKPATGCKNIIDSIYYITGRLELPFDRFYSVNEFVKVDEYTSADGKSSKVRYRLPFSLIKQKARNGEIVTELLRKGQGINFYIKYKTGDGKCVEYAMSILEDELL
jgi:hypothetical protein